MKYLLDTNMVTDYLEKHPQVVERLEAVAARDRYLSIITLGELRHYHGIFNSKQVEKHLLQFRKFLSRTKTLPFTPPIAARFGRSASSGAPGHRRLDRARQGDSRVPDPVAAAARAVAMIAAVEVAVPRRRCRRRRSPRALVDGDTLAGGLIEGERFSPAYRESS